MFFLVFEATPRADNPEVEDFGGSFVSCWIERPTLEEATSVARQMIEGEGWIVGELDEGYLIDQTAYEIDGTGFEFYEQAIIDKEVIVFHTFPIAGRAEEE